MKIERNHAWNIIAAMISFANSKSKIGAKTAYCFTQNISDFEKTRKSILAYLKEIDYTEYEEKIQVEIDKVKKEFEPKIKEYKKENDVNGNLMNAINKEIKDRLKPLLDPIKEKYKEAIEKKEKFFSEEIEFDFNKIKLSDFIEKDIIKNEVDSVDGIMFWKPIIME